MSGIKRIEAVRGGIKLVEKLAQYIQEKTGFVLTTQVQVGDAGTSIVQAAGAAESSLVTVGQWSDADSRKGNARRFLRSACGPVLIVKRKPSSAYRRVLVAIDESENARACIEQARALAPEADLVVVRALDFAMEDRLRYADASEEKILEFRMRRHERALDRLTAILADAGVPRHRVVKIVEHAYAPSLILETERKFLIDLLVIGRGNGSLLKRCFFPGVSSQVIDAASCDVLVVPTIAGANG